MARPRILVVDDEPDLRTLLEFNLRGAGFEVLARSSGRDAIACARTERPDLIVLDLMLPDVQGTDVCRALQAATETRSIPIVMLTARGAELDRVLGLELGAEDYITKPFSVRELILRIRKILARGGQTAASGAEKRGAVLAAGPIRVDLDYHRVTVAGAEVPLTATETKLLAHLLRSSGRVQSRTHLLDQVWGGETDVTERTVDTHVKRLRAKLGEAGDAIETVRGIGYRLRAPDA